MSATMGRVFNSLRRVALNTEELFHNTTTTVRLSSVRPLAMSSQMQFSSKKPNDEHVSGPIKFSTSKASHKTWKVKHSMGSHQQPWWKALTVSFLSISFVLWCALRGQTDVDEKLNKSLYDHLPNLISDDDDDEEEETVQNQSN